MQLNLQIRSAVCMFENTMGSDSLKTDTNLSRDILRKRVVT